MSFDAVCSEMDAVCLRTFGRAFTFTPALAPAVPITITGILESAAMVEDLSAGDGSTYARLWVMASDFSVAPVVGDEVSSTNTVYKILRMEEDVAGGIWLLLRKDRAVA